MSPYETSATVESHGDLHLGGLPFPPGTPVEVTVHPKQAASATKQPALDELDQVYQACRGENWDAQGAEPIAAETLHKARRFIESLPSGFPLPSAGAEPDGHVTLEWYRATNWLLSVSVSPEGVLYYAALLGDEDPRGSCRFESEVPETIL